MTADTKRKPFPSSTDERGLVFEVAPGDFLLMPVTSHRDAHDLARILGVRVLHSPDIQYPTIVRGGLSA